MKKQRIKWLWRPVSSALRIVMLAVFVGNPSTSLAKDTTGLPNDIASGWGGGWLKSMANGYRPYGYRIVDEQEGHPVRFGQKSIRFEVRPGDCGNNGSWDDCTNDRERHELSQLNNFQKHGHQNWYAWSIYRPASNPNIFPTITILGQFHQKDSGKPFFLFTSNHAALTIDNQVPDNRSMLANLIAGQEAMADKWVDILVDAKWSHNRDGHFKIYANHELKYDYKGPTLAKGRQSFFKFGVYRSWVSRFADSNNGTGPPTQVVYYDELRKGKSLSEVDRVGIADVQRFLKARGLYTSLVDGLWGTGSRRAANSYLASIGENPVSDYSIEFWKLVHQKNENQ